MKGPFLAEPIAHREAAVTAMELARLAGVCCPPSSSIRRPRQRRRRLSRADLAAWKDTAALSIAARARLPVPRPARTAEIVAFRSADDLREHVALVIGEHDGDRAPLVRLHSECLTGDILGSLKCDCGPQLDAALQRHGRGGGPGEPGACCSICARKGAGSA